ncbi:MAG TPA: hypothetical protein DHV26_04860 [Cytophagales bacterium]|nr:hypothetical protein [Cytophagales bacterium]
MKGCQTYKKPTGFGEVFLNPKKTSFELFFGRNLPLLTCFLGEGPDKSGMRPGLVLELHSVLF